MVFHGLNRGVARMQLFERPADYQAFELVLRETVRSTRAPVRTHRIAERNRETARVGVGLSSGGASAKSGK
jgi:hypothetical protein